MTCKIKGALLLDDNFMRAFADVADNLQLPYQLAFGVWKIGNEMGLAFEKVEEVRAKILEEHSVKRNDGTPKVDNKGQFKYKDQRKVEEVLMVELNKDIELDCDLLCTKDLEKGVITPSLINAIGLISPIIAKQQ